MNTIGTTFSAEIGAKQTGRVPMNAGDTRASEQGIMHDAAGLNWLQSWIDQCRDNYTGFYGLNAEKLIAIAGDDELLYLFTVGCRHYREGTPLPTVGKKPPRTFFSGAYAYLWFFGFTQQRIAIIFGVTQHQIQVCIRYHSLYDDVKHAHLVRMYIRQIEAYTKKMEKTTNKGVWQSRIDETQNKLEQAIADSDRFKLRFRSD